MRWTYGLGNGTVTPHFFGLKYVFMGFVANLRFTSAGLAAAVLVAGCSSEPTCDYSKAPYMSAQSVPALRAPEGLSAPDRSGALVVPPVPPNAKPVPTGKGKCLDRPPSYFATTPTKPNETAPEKQK
jgi:hypothetical protein